MNSNQKTARIVGILFVMVMVTWAIGYSLIDPILNAPDYLLNVYPNESRVMLGVLFEVIETAGVIGIIVLMVPILRKQNESITLGYAGFRIMESIMLLVAAISALIMITLSADYIAAGAPQASYYETSGALLLAARGEWSSMILAIFYSLGALSFFYLLYQSQLIPRFISVPALIVGSLVGISNVLAFLGINFGMIFGVPMGLIEIFLGLWLIIKGFSIPAVDGVSSDADINNDQPAKSQ